MNHQDTLRPARNLAMDLVRVTEAAAISAARFIGKGDAESAGKAATEAMRAFLRTVDLNGAIVIGEEKGQHFMLCNGEQVGSGAGPQADIAAAPVEGASLLAQGQPNSIAAIALADRGSMWNPGHSFYMNKIVVKRKAREAIDIRLSPTENLHRIAESLGRKVSELTVFVLDKPRHGSLIEEIRQAGARITLHSDGDVMGALMAALPGTGVDVLMGVGGASEGLITAAAVKALGGGMQGMRAPQREDEKRRLKEDHVKIREVLTLDKLIRSDNTVWAATGITQGTFLEGVDFGQETGIITHSIAIRALTGSIRFIKSIHQLDPQPSGGPADATPAQVAFEVVE